MSLTATNVIMGPGTLYTGAFSATEPADAAVNTTPAVSAWTDLGGTDGGVKFGVDNTYTELSVDQVVDRLGSRLTKRDIMVSTNLAEPTLENLSVALNGGTAASGSGYKSFEPDYATSATQPDYIAIILDGFAPSQLRRRVIVRKVLSTAKVDTEYTKDKQTFFPVEFTSHYVSSVIAPFKVIDEVS